MGLLAGVQLLAGVVVLAFSPGAGRISLGTFFLTSAAITAFFAYRRRANAN